MVDSENGHQFQPTPTRRAGLFEANGTAHLCIAAAANFSTSRAAKLEPTTKAPLEL
jgi:hypothetical protein